MGDIIHLSQRGMQYALPTHQPTRIAPTELLARSAITQLASAAHAYFDRFCEQMTVLDGLYRDTDAHIAPQMLVEVEELAGPFAATMAALSRHKDLGDANLQERCHRCAEALELYADSYRSIACDPVKHGGSFDQWVLIAQCMDTLLAEVSEAAARSQGGRRR